MLALQVIHITFNCNIIWNMIAYSKLSCWDVSLNVYICVMVVQRKAGYLMRELQRCRLYWWIHERTWWLRFYETSWKWGKVFSHVIAKQRLFFLSAVWLTAGFHINQALTIFWLMPWDILEWLLLCGSVA